MPTAIGAYPDAGPLSGYVPSSRMEFAVTPGVAAGRAPAVAPTAAATARAATTSRNVFLMRSLLLRVALGGAWGGGYESWIRKRSGGGRRRRTAPRRGRPAARRRRPRARIR